MLPRENLPPRTITETVQTKRRSSPRVEKFVHWQGTLQQRQVRTRTRKTPHHDRVNDHQLPKRSGRIESPTWRKRWGNHPSQRRKRVPQTGKRSPVTQNWNPCTKVYCRNWKIEQWTQVTEGRSQLRFLDWKIRWRFRERRGRIKFKGFQRDSFWGAVIPGRNWEEEYRWAEFHLTLRRYNWCVEGTESFEGHQQ